MYLHKKTYVKNWSHQDFKHEVIVKKNGKKRKDIDPKKVVYVEEEVACWRKANAIHDWFVKHAGENLDNCQPCSVSREQLVELRDACATVLAGSQMKNGKVKNGYTSSKETNFEMKANMEDGKYIEDASIAKALLPTQEGFFFGSTDYDQYYYEDIKYTKEVLDEILSVKGDDAEYYYEASW